MCQSYERQLKIPEEIHEVEKAYFILTHKEMMGNHGKEKIEKTKNMNS